MQIVQSVRCDEGRGTTYRAFVNKNPLFIYFIMKSYDQCITDCIENYGQANTLRAT